MDPVRVQSGPSSTRASAERRGPARNVEAPPDKAVNRDLSWLEFNRRVLHLSMDQWRPLLDRVRFLAIFSSNLDEFFMKRAGLLKGRIAAGLDAFQADGQTHKSVLAGIRRLVLELQEQQARCWQEQLVPALRQAGIHLLTYADLTREEQRAIDAWFNAHVFPILTPLAVDPGHRFPFISNLSENLGILLSQPGDSERHFARVKIPDVLPRLIPVPDDAGGSAPRGATDTPRTSADGGAPHERDPRPTRLIPLEEVIKHNLDDLFCGMTIHDIMPFRLTRNAAVEQDDDPEDLLKSVETELRMRRFAGPVRIEVGTSPSPIVLDFIVEALGLTHDDVYQRGGPLEYGDLFQLADLPRSDLKEPPWRPVVPARLADEDADIFAIIRERDVLLHHPYESFNASVERFIAQAARDPDVLAIKQTLYRTSPDSPFVASLIRAAEAGKQVACMVEVRARFDENRNVRFARLLEKNGVHVAYGVVGLKTHCKCSLVVRREEGGLRCYAHLGTGNYNPRTAQLYTDIGILTCDPAICDDVVSVFNFLTGRSQKRDYKELIIAPHAMRDRFIELIDGEIAVARAGGHGRVIAKMNSFEDPTMMHKLYEASQAGVKITLMVRGFCCLRPGVPGLSDNIDVLSIVGRFLEHSRVFFFGRGEADPLDGAWYIGSADWMYRNLSNRVEIVTPVKDRQARARISRVLQIMLEDRACAWRMNPDGSYDKLAPRPEATADSPEVLGTFRTLMRETRAGG